ncbi:hypothetical protein F0562_025834 [Nyssa sinensis]|uniref:AB hydrolase-1 domain-containing protein n=1 Tax=Nyssa sinensis TaxID=561372 RepID=A0A5J5BB81_9ASTE|nr:hypothetical protein F0562_025834 [Nyssa sinensis]
MFKIILMVLLIGFLTWAFQSTQPPPPNICGFLGLLIGLLVWAYQSIRPPTPNICASLGSPPITAPRIKLRDGRHLANKEHGVPKEMAKYKIIFVHGFSSSRHDTSLTTSEIFEELGVYLVSFDRPVCNIFEMLVMDLQFVTSSNNQAHMTQQGVFESLHRDMRGDEDGLVPVTLQRYIAERLPWIHYHELPGAGHLFPGVDGMSEAIMKTLLLGE